MADWSDTGPSAGRWGIHSYDTEEMRAAMELVSFLPLIVIMGAFMFFASRRQRKAMQATIDLHDSLRVGDRVLTTSGLQGNITGITDDTVDLEIAPGVITRWIKLAIRDRVEPDVDGADYASRAVELTDSDADRLPKD
jgi:preprotein translocase subunit YajC